MNTSEFLSAQRENLPILLTRDHVAGKTFIVTGSNSGIGRDAARHVVKLGAARVILAVRSASRGAEAKTWIEQTTSITGVVEVWSLDTTNWDSIRAFSKRANTELERIDGFVQNAAASGSKWETNKEGHETTIAGNVIGTMMLAFHLLPRMSETAKKFGGTPHLVFLTSGLGFSQPDAMQLVDAKGGAFAALNREGESPITPTPKRYSVSNLYKMMAVREFSKLIRHSDTGVVMNMLSPGYCKTGLAKDGPLHFRIIFNVVGAIIGRTPEMGSRTILHAMQGGPESHGALLSDCKIKEYMVADWLTNEKGQAIQRKAWGQLLEVIEQAEPGLFDRMQQSLLMAQK